MPKLNAFEIAEVVLNHVRYDYSIGPANRKGTQECMSTQEKTGDWAFHMLAGVRFGFLNFSKENTPGKNRPHWVPKFKFGDTPATCDHERFIAYKSKRSDGNELKMTEYTWAERNLNSIMNKVGNCDEMSRAAYVRAMDVLSRTLDENDTFFIEKLKLVDIDHNILRIGINGKIAICDPWIEMAFELPDDLAKFKQKMLHQFSFENLVSLDCEWPRNIPLLENPLPNREQPDDLTYHIDSHQDLYRARSNHEKIRTHFLRLWPCFFERAETLQNWRDEHEKAFEPTLQRIKTLKRGHD